ncbi:MAG: ATP-binding cassette domain-containing protein [Bacteroidales bacterium]|jgi:putative ABC transport system ATP-binding protein|nr:ATP-binding cassette domain-containing protein [Bacteroidales bacterium]MDD3430803.1 ATP-binding cassette domain-containing protein [Bacteroidales bacterium]MDD4361799.1 ATP-binding cassette domain-containing protein [Bacteroidales bacterium]MDD4431080.1 ATP-binding cassette domain-containing protein [Bacteroidales bacterium]
MIECRNIFLSFGDKEIFKDLNFSILEGEHYCVTGSSGRGKSTLLKLIQAYVRPDRGRIIIQGKELNAANIKVLREFTAWIPQNINLPVQNGLELLDMLHMKHKRPQVEQYAFNLGLEAPIIEQPFAIISGGQKQRLVMAICFALDKSIILMDEPTASLDEDSIQLLLRTIGQMKDRTILSASHNQTWINAVPKRIAL